MKITEVSSTLLAVPIKKPIRTAIHRMEQLYHIVVEVKTDRELTGTGLLFTPYLYQARLLQAAVASFTELVVGEDPLMVEAVWQKLWKAMNWIGNSGVSIFAQSALDTALWDIAGKAAGWPVYQLLGAKTKSLPAYASNGLWLASSVEELVEEAQGFVEQGFSYVKMRLGSARLEDDIARARAVRAAIGPDINMMADANQGWNATTAIKFGRAVADLNLFWLEEPVPYYDIESSAAIAAALNTPLASGETEYTYVGFAHLQREKAADIWMPDLQRVGGISGWRKIATLGESYNIPVSPHIFPEVSIHAALAAPTCQIIEHVDWWEPLFQDQDDRPRLVAGRMEPGTRPGLGLSVSPKTIETYRVH